MNLFLNVYQSSSMFFCSFLFFDFVHLAGKSLNETTSHATSSLRMPESYPTSNLPRQEHLADGDARIRLCSKCRIIKTYLNCGFSTKTTGYWFGFHVGFQVCKPNTIAGKTWDARPPSSSHLQGHCIFSTGSLLNIFY